LLNGLNK
jgi:hypothetical protein